MPADDHASVRKARSEAGARLCIIVPVFNEADALPDFYQRLHHILRPLSYCTTVLFVDDGSSDRTPEILTEISRKHPEVTYLRLARNFGHQAALTAGIETADADVAIMMDGDGQHPAELIPEMLQLYEQGYDVVQTQRDDAAQPRRRWKHWTSRAFYWLISKLGEIDLAPGAADFRLVSSDALNALRRMHEYHRFIRGMVSWIGFRTIILPYTAGDRLAGHSKYSLRKMIRLAADGLFSFSLVPLRLGIAVGCLFLFIAAIELSYVMAFWLLRNPAELVPGWSSLILMVTLGHGITMILLGFIGIYVGMIFQQVKGRPVYIVRAVDARQPAAFTAAE